MNTSSNDTFEKSVSTEDPEVTVQGAVTVDLSEETPASQESGEELFAAPEPIETIDPIVATEPVDATEPIEAAEPVNPANLIEPVEPAVSVETAESAEPVNPANLIEPVEPAESVETVESAEPVNPVKPAEPVESMDDYQKELDSSLRKIYEGDVMEGEVIAFNEHGVILDLSYYATGRVPVEEMSADPSFNIMTDVHIGDRFQAIVKRVDDGHGNILLSKKAAESEYSWDTLRQMKDDETVIEGTITEVVKAGAIMYIHGIRGFIPASRLDFKYVEDTSTFLGKKLPVRIIEVDEEQDKLILSAREIATEAHVKKQAEDISRLSVGSIVTGKVESLQNYGAFVDIGGGISGLLHISEISEKRINHPKAALRVGQEVTVMIIRIQDGKISLSIKAIEAAKEQEAEEEAHEYHSEYVPNNPFADLLKDYLK